MNHSKETKHNRGRYWIISLLPLYYFVLFIELIVTLNNKIDELLANRKLFHIYKTDLSFLGLVSIHCNFPIALKPSFSYNVRAGLFPTKAQMQASSPDLANCFERYFISNNPYPWRRYPTSVCKIPSTPNVVLYSDK